MKYVYVKAIKPCVWFMQFYLSKKSKSNPFYLMDISLIRSAKVQHKFCFDESNLNIVMSFTIFGILC